MIYLYKVTYIRTPWIGAFPFLIILRLNAILRYFPSFPPVPM